MITPSSSCNSTAQLHFIKPEGRKRIDAIDLTRLFAIFMVMIAHLPFFANPDARILATNTHMALGIEIVTFFIFAGYFAAKNITWSKAAKGFMWLLATFIFWNLLCLLVRVCFDSFPASHRFYCDISRFNWHSLWGVAAIFSPTLLLGDKVPIAFPINGPLWFLRDLIFLTLFTPLLFRWAKPICIICLICSFLPSTRYLLDPHGQTLLGINSIACYTVGCYIRRLSDEKQNALLTFRNPYLIAFIYIGGFYLAKDLGRTPFWLALLKTWALYQVALTIDHNFPQITRKLASLAPVVALVFFGHIIIWPYLPLQTTWAVYVYPFAVFAFFAGVFFALKRWCPSIPLYLIAHYKRPQCRS